MKIRPAYLALWIGLMTMGSVQAQFMRAENLVKIQSAISVDTVHPGSSFQVAVIGDVEEGWHVNANPPTLEYLIPTEVKLEPVDGLTFGKMQYPPATRLKFAFAEDFEPAFKILFFNIPPPVNTKISMLSFWTKSANV